jgi:hypothetical protein
MLPTAGKMDTTSYATRHTGLTQGDTHTVAIPSPPLRLNTDELTYFLGGHVSKIERVQPL